VHPDVADAHHVLCLDDEAVEEYRIPARALPHLDEIGIAIVDDDPEPVPHPAEDRIELVIPRRPVYPGGDEDGDILRGDPPFDTLPDQLAEDRAGIRDADRILPSAGKEIGKGMRWGDPPLQHRYEVRRWNLDPDRTPTIGERRVNR